ncbi:uncharacterized protein BT62DRAFT_999946 [Guyanagaster necrorhizus]|uniref:Uncharacterized protein n=1 Tax=Guyanagaster necrorhizus TaxID=856835 RepID=A0A9P7W3X9_9AGAR|nr:uncharacterized protein BT62DRAFT_999946 [Guyanagaster necrorhizus MCA 3950]KAG7452188.1 hypothetical protein BT62DRAFT_999946 [Guyanagaster necrorhizus MCA 3950]
MSEGPPATSSAKRASKGEMSIKGRSAKGGGWRAAGPLATYSHHPGFMNSTLDMNADSQLFTLLREYAAIVPTSQMRYPHSIPKDTLHDFLLRSIILGPHFRKYSPSKQYQKSFWKWIVQHLELDVEIDTQILSILTETSTSTFPRGISVPAPPSPSYVTHYWRLDTPSSSNETPVTPECFRTTLFESGTMIESGTTGFRTWPASLHLANYIIMHPEWVYGRRILELGSGIGFLGMIAGSLQMLTASSTDIPPGDTSRPMLYLTDVDSDVIARYMTASMDHRDSISVSMLDWSDALRPDSISAFKARLQQEINADLIIGADIVFDPSLIPALMATLSLALDPGFARRQRVALIALTIRNKETYATFRATAQKYNLVIVDLEYTSTDSLFFHGVDERADQKHDVKIMKITIQ